MDILKRNMCIKDIYTIAGKKIYSGTIYGKDLIIAVSGIGKVNMAVAS